MKNIVLIGYRCTGKSSVGKELSERLHRPFFDTDDIITGQTGLSIKEIVERGGWNLFRRKERKVITQMAATGNGIIATGGGMFDNSENRSIMKQNGFFIWLTADAETIMSRLLSHEKSESQRPPLSRDDLATETISMLQKREPIYRDMADLIIDTTGRDIGTVTDEICRFITSNGELQCREIQ
jgi:shikimate kinase